MGEQREEQGIHPAVAMLLEKNLRQYADDRELDLNSCVKIYQTVFETLVDVFKASNVQITNESMNWLAQQYYDGIQINNRYELDPDIFSQRAKLENIETKEVALLATMMRGTDFAIPLVMEIKRRS
jgi:hypothetical protein